MLEVGLVVPNPFIFMPWTKFKKLDLCTKTNHVCIADRILESGFVATASTLKARPSLLCLEAQMNGRIVPTVDKSTTHFFMS